MSDGIQKKENLDVVDGWMGTYGDMVTLLMAFFVLLYAFSDPDPGKMGELSSALNSALTNEEVKNEFKGLEKQLEEIVEDAELTEEVEISQTIKGIEIQMEGSTLYESCSADVNEDMAPVIASI